VDAADGAVLYANEAARSARGDGAGDGAPPEALLARVRERAEGRARSDVPGLPGVAVWWTAAPGRRVLGVVAPAVAEADGDLRALAELGRGTALLAHELRNPLAGMASALDLLAGDLPERDRADVVELAGRRLASMRALLDDTLRFARPLPGRPAPLDAAAVLRAAVAVARAEPAFAGLALAAEAPASAPALGHEQALHQALVNLLLNSAQALAPRGSGTVTASVEARGPWVVLRVRDDGPGIAPESLERAFAPFWTTKPTGTGLGLAFVRRVAEAAGGHAVAERVPSGASIRVEIPAAP
jgi:signal transduction histidine kinase